MGFAFIYPALPTCLVVYVQKSDFYLINVFCVVIDVKKCKLLCLAQVVFSCFVLHSSKIPLVLTTKRAHLHSLFFRQLNGVNCVIRRVYFGLSSQLLYNMDVNHCVHVGSGGLRGVLTGLQPGAPNI